MSIWVLLSLYGCLLLLVVSVIGLYRQYVKVRKELKEKPSAEYVTQLAEELGRLADRVASLKSDSSLIKSVLHDEMNQLHKIKVLTVGKDGLAEEYDIGTLMDRQSFYVGKSKKSKRRTPADPEESLRDRLKTKCEELYPQGKVG